MKRHTILFYGDSNTYGFDPRSPYGDDRYGEEIRWTDRLKRETAGRWEILVNAMNGRRIPSDPYSFQSLTDMLEDLARQGKLDWFAVMLGTNDILSGPPEETAILTAGRMDAFLRALQRKSEKAKILLIAPPLVGSEETADPLLLRYREQGRRMNDMMWRVAQKRDVAFLDAGMWDLPMAYDEIHFSEEGHVKFAERMLRWLRAME